MNKLIMTFAAAILGLLPSRSEAQAPSKKWAINYSDQVNTAELEPYDLIILDSRVGSIVPELKKENKEVFAYLSLGEVSNERSYFNEAKANNLLLNENPNWPGSYVVDLRNPLWSEMLVGEIIPKILKKNFTGLFLDTLDTPLYLEETKPEKYRGMSQAAITLVQTLRKKFPNIKLMLNRSYKILPDVAPFVNDVLAESLYSKYDFSRNKYTLVPPEEYNHSISLLQNLKKQHPHLEIYVLDYWNPKDPDTIRNIYSLQRKWGFFPYVSTVDLMQITPEPS